MDTRKESLAPVGNVIRTQQKRDRLLNLLMVSREQERIAKERWHRYEDISGRKENEYKEWCKNNLVDSLID